MNIKANHTETVRHIMPLVEEVGFPDELIINYWPEYFFQYLDIGA